MHFAPYIYFYGRCEEALEFYKGVFGGTYEAMRIAGSPMAEHSPPDFQQKILHATFTAPGISFMAADGRPGSVDPEAGNIALSISTDETEGTRIFDALAEGGTVSMPPPENVLGRNLRSTRRPLRHRVDAQPHLNAGSSDLRRSRLGSNLRCA